MIMNPKKNKKTNIKVALYYMCDGYKQITTQHKQKLSNTMRRTKGEGHMSDLALVTLTLIILNINY